MKFTPDSSAILFRRLSRTSGQRRRTKQLSKEFVSLVDSKRLSRFRRATNSDEDEYIETVSDRYIELYEKFLRKFIKADISNINERIEKMFWHI
jgi:phosphoribosylaminoimidazole-succinocarboxamide synthase